MSVELVAPSILPITESAEVQFVSINYLNLQSGLMVRENVELAEALSLPNILDLKNETMNKAKGMEDEGFVNYWGEIGPQYYSFINHEIAGVLRSEILAGEQYRKMFPWADSIANADRIIYVSLIKGRFDGFLFKVYSDLLVQGKELGCDYLSAEVVNKRLRKTK